MAIISVGYEGTVLEGQWATLIRLAGAEYDLESQGALLVTSVAGLDRTVQVAVGNAFGHGVYDTNTSPVNIQLPVIASGTRWDLIVVRRDWRPASPTNGTTTFVSITGTAVRQIPSGRNTQPGTIDDQPLALVQVTAGQTQPTAVVDLRTFASKVVTVPELLAAPTRPGTIARVGETEYHRIPDPSGNLAWVPEPKLHTTRVTASGPTDHGQPNQKGITTTVQRNCPTGLVMLLMHAQGGAVTGPVTGQITIQVDGADTSHAAITRFDVVGPAGEQTMSIAVTRDVTPGRHAFRLVGQRRSGSGASLFTVPSASLSIIDVRP